MLIFFFLAKIHSESFSNFLKGRLRSNDIVHLQLKRSRAELQVSKIRLNPILRLRTTTCCAWSLACRQLAKAQPDSGLSAARLVNNGFSSYCPRHPHSCLYPQRERATVCLSQCLCPPEREREGG